MKKQKNNISFLIRRLIYAFVLVAVGYGVSTLLGGYGYPKMTLFYIITGVAALGIIINIINYFCTFFYEDSDSLVIKKGTRGKAYYIPYTIITECVIQEGCINKMLKTKSLTIRYTDYKGYPLNETLGLSTEYADKLLHHITKKRNGEYSEFPKHK